MMYRIIALAGMPTACRAASIFKMFKKKDTPDGSSDVQNGSSVATETSASSTTDNKFTEPVKYTAGKVEDFYNIDAKKPRQEDVGKYIQKTGEHKESRVACGIQIVKKGTPSFKQEQEDLITNILMKLDHPNIVKCKEVFQDEEAIYRVVDYCIGGQLDDDMIKAGSFKEDKAAHVLKQMASAVKYLHENGIMHRELQDCHWILPSSGGPMRKHNPLKLKDFKMATLFQPGEVLTTSCGFPYTVAPEVLVAKEYNEKADVWSLGVLLYRMINGYEYPFEGLSDADILAEVKKGKWDFKSEYSEEYFKDKKELQDLIKKILVVNPKKRATIDQVLQHPWVVSNAK